MGDFKPFQEKMENEGLSGAAITAFQNAYSALVSGASTMIPEADLEPLAELPALESLKVEPCPDLLEETVVLKLNGGLGTSMGLDKAKSLLIAKGQDSFLDLIAKQVLATRAEHGRRVRFVLMNSFSTSADTRAALRRRYPALAGEPGLELLQNKVPKVAAGTLAPAAWPPRPGAEWCPPGHGDLYAALAGSGRLDALLAEGVKYMFVSNSDNLGATLDLHLLTHFAQSGMPFLMECCRRGETDRKGGHLARRRGRLALREAAQCAPGDEGHFQDISRHRFFNTNNLWVRLDRLKEALEANGGAIPLPVMKNDKTVDPQDPSSPAVIQLETAMGAAIECFDGAGAIVVPRSRFAPVKKCPDLLTLRSDAYLAFGDGRLALHPDRAGVVPVVSLDPRFYATVGQLEALCPPGGGAPSLRGCDRLEVEGQVLLGPRAVLRGAVRVTNRAPEPKALPPGQHRDAEVDLTGRPGLGPLRPTGVPTAPIQGQKMGTSGLRRKTRVFMGRHYLQNLVQSALDALRAAGTDPGAGGALLLGGDGRYFNLEAIQIIVKIAAANGVRRILIGKDGLLSTPAVSAVIRERGPIWQKAFGAFILTASHNPGGPEADFGIKYNCENGGPAPERLADLIYEHTLQIRQFRICEAFPEIDLSKVGAQRVVSDDGSQAVIVEVIDSCEDHVKLLRRVFDFDLMRRLIARPDFSMVYDAMHGVMGPYAEKVLCSALGLPRGRLRRADPRPDFGGGPADPTPARAGALVSEMGLDSKGLPVETSTLPPCFGAAADGDADRNMILGRNFFVTPSDSLAIVAAHANAIPFFRDQGGIKGVARSMPTSAAVDLVAKRYNLELFETPTGWKFFGSLMDSALLGGTKYGPFLCGEESFGTGSDHLREKDGLWAVLAWLQILALYNSDPVRNLVHVEDIVKNHWRTFGRNYYCRYDYEGVNAERAEAMMSSLVIHLPSLKETVHAGSRVTTADEFEYRDPVDGSITRKQGIRIIFEDGSRVVFRLSGTAGCGATVRLYLERYEGPTGGRLGLDTTRALGPLAAFALRVARVEDFLGRAEPDVVT